MLVEFRKDDIVRHLGLLDLQRTMQRALRRSGLPIKYSSGFNPHIVMSFASALSTGIPGDAELLDVSLSGEVTERECLEAMNRVLPPSLPVTRVRLVEDDFPKVMAALRQAEYRIRLSGEGTDAIVAAIPAFLAETEIMAMRKSKRGEALVNIRPMLHALTAEHSGSEEAVLQARVSFVETATLKPDLLLSSLAAYANAPLPHAEIRRTRLLGEKNGVLTPLIDL
ncbi:MAG: TIGR03936 family radical SAM-associated protein [Clostridiales bacterium]|nr:TIGR03936 family radical SAM-associated protein [Clostridiales bacterium]